MFPTRRTSTITRDNLTSAIAAYGQGGIPGHDRDTQAANLIAFVTGYDFVWSPKKLGRLKARVIKLAF